MTLTPNGILGDMVNGHPYVETIQAAPDFPTSAYSIYGTTSEGGDELAAIPYTYRVGAP